MRRLKPLHRRNAALLSSKTKEERGIKASEKAKNKPV